MLYEQLFRGLNEGGVRYIVVGGVALVLHGVVRLTVDLDLVVDLAPANVRAFLATLTHLGYTPRLPVRAEEFADPALRAAWKSEKGMRVFSFRHPERQIEPVDVFLEEPLPFEVLWVARESFTARGIGIPVVSVSHLKQLKQASARPQDQADFRALTDLDTEPGGGRP